MPELLRKQDDQDDPATWLNTEERLAIKAILREVHYWTDHNLEASFVARVEGIKRAINAREDYVSRSEQEVNQTPKDHFDRGEVAQIISHECFHMNWDQVKGIPIVDIMRAVRSIQRAGYIRRIRTGESEKAARLVALLNLVEEFPEQDRLCALVAAVEIQTQESRLKTNEGSHEL